MRATKAFTLVELMVTMVVLSIVILVTFSIIRHTSMMWLSTNARLTSLEAATAGFDLITRQVSQATLNTYWDYNSRTDPTQYVRASELNFCMGNAGSPNITAGHNYNSLLPDLSTLNLSATSAVTHAIFFQAPLGYTATKGKAPDFSPLGGMLNTVGFYVAYTSERDLPSFLNIAPKQRFRLYQLVEPSEQLRVYSQSAGQDPYGPKDWFTANLGTASRKIADNVIGLILRARYPNPQDPSGTGYTETYLYDSRDAGSPLTLNQQPPIVSVTMVVIDEDSAKRLGSAYQDIGQPANTFIDPANYKNDLQIWEKKLSGFIPKINYRIYNANITIRDAKWSSN